jgi:ferric-chelate reductase [NAD(P)H]
MAIDNLIDINAFLKVTYGLYIVSSKSNDRLNGFISNSVFQVTAEPNKFAVCCHKNNFTASLIKESNVFSVSVLQKETKPRLIGLFGYKSGRDVNKYESVNYIFGKTGAPVVVDDTLAWFECEVLQTIDVGTHLLFIGEVVSSDMVNSEAEPLTYKYYREVKKGFAPENAPTFIDRGKIKDKARASGQAGEK